MNSMTGFGRGDAAGEGVTWMVEVSSVNRKQLEVVVGLSRELGDLEMSIRNTVSAACSRGRVQVQVRGDSAGTLGSALKLDEVLAQQYAASLERLSAMLKLPNQFTLSEAARWPGVLELERSVPDAEKAWPLIEQALASAMKGFLAMRSTEGLNLKQDIEARLATLADLLKQIESRAGDVPQLYRKALLQRLHDAGLPVNLDDERLIKEIALFAERCDISEEITRARSHFGQFTKYLASSEAVGRSLDFLTQELGREFNTMGSKANNAELAHLVVAAKSEIEKMREQIQNVE
jgi:uncharacterized protein (TIGR00255 family)